jgi:LacI family transcriptional regulator
VLRDDLAVGRLAAEHLLERGMRNFGFLGHQDRHYARLRAQGFTETIGRHGFHCNTLFLPADSGTHTSAHSAEEQLQLSGWIASLPKPVGVLASTDHQGRLVAETCRNCGVSIPHELALIGVDNHEYICRAVVPQLSSVDPNVGELGYQAGRLMQDLLAGKAPPAKPIIVPPLGVAARQSTEVLAFLDPVVARAVSMIREHLHERIRINELARVTGVSRRTLQIKFGRVIGRSPHDELVRLRIEQAKHLLAQSELPADEIAHQCGFKHVSPLYAAFKRIVGVPPVTYRKMHRQR